MSMVATARQIQSKRRNFSLRQTLSDTYYGVYLATCCIGHEQRWTNQKPVFRSLDCLQKLMENF